MEDFGLGKCKFYLCELNISTGALSLLEYFKVDQLFLTNHTVSLCANADFQSISFLSLLQVQYTLPYFVRLVQGHKKKVTLEIVRDLCHFFYFVKFPGKMFITLED